MSVRFRELQRGSRSPGINPGARGVCASPPVGRADRDGGVVVVGRAASAEERSRVGEEVVRQCAEECDAGDLFQAADQDVSGAVMGFEVRVDELAETGS